MSAPPRHPMYGLAGLRMTADEYLAAIGGGETPERTELIDGVVVMAPSPSRRHQRLFAHLVAQFVAYEEREGGTVLPDTDLRLGTSLVYCPDIAYFLRGRLPDDGRKPEIPPDLVLEFLSPGSRPLDLMTKRGDYERFGVGEYWVLDPDPLSIRRWRREGERFVEQAGDVGDSVASAALPGFSLDMRALRAVKG